MSDFYNPQDASLWKMVTDARRLLDYAVSRGLIKDVSMITAITDIEATVTSKERPDQSKIDAFLKAYNTLSGLTEGVSGSSLSLESEKDAQRTSRIYATLLIVLLLLLVPATAVTLVGKRLIDDTLADITWICTTEESLGCSDQKFQKVVSSTQDVTGQDGIALQYGSAVRTNSNFTSNAESGVLCAI